MLMFVIRLKELFGNKSNHLLDNKHFWKGSEMLTPCNSDSLDLMVVCRAFFNQVRTINEQLRGINPAEDIKVSIGVLFGYK